MLRKAKITAVPVDDQPDLALKNTVEEEPKPDAEKMTDVLNEVNVTDTVLSIEDEVPEVQSAPAAPKAKARRVSTKEPVFKEPEVEVTSSLDEVQAEVVLPVELLLREEYHETINPREKTSCPDCGKQVSAKTLKYSHGPNCVVKKQKQSQPTISREDGNHSLGTEVTKEQNVSVSNAK